MSLMVHVMRKVETDPVKDRLKSSWTPLTDTQMNLKIFEERRTLVVSWFSKWTEYQRKQIFLDLLPICTEKQLEYMENVLRDKVPKHQVDFTRTLPRILCLYILSFLDPRSLCRCARVCWYWKYLAEANELWAPKCLRRGWILNDINRTSEQGIWKRHYIQNMRFLQVAGPMKATAIELMKQLEQAHKEARLQSELERKRQKEEIRSRQQQLQLSEAERQARVTQKLVPWRAPNRNPSETGRMNHFDNQSPRREDTTNTEQRRNRSADPVKIQPENSVGLESVKPSPVRRLPRERKRLSRVNPRIATPKVPWRPSSRNPARPSVLATEETKQKFVDVQAYLRRQSAPIGLCRPQSALHITTQDETTRAMVDSGKIVRPMSVQAGWRNSLTSRIQRMSESEAKLEELPPPPVYVDKSVEEGPAIERQNRRSRLSSACVSPQQFHKQAARSASPLPLPPPPASLQLMQNQERGQYQTQNRKKTPSSRSEKLDGTQLSSSAPKETQKMTTIPLPEPSCLSTEQPCEQSGRSEKQRNFTVINPRDQTQPHGETESDKIGTEQLQSFTASKKEDYEGIGPAPKPRRMVTVDAQPSAVKNSSMKYAGAPNVRCDTIGDTFNLPNSSNLPPPCELKAPDGD